MAPDPCRLHVEGNLGHSQGRLQTEDIPIEFGIVDGVGRCEGRAFVLTPSPTEIPIDLLTEGRMTNPLDAVLMPVLEPFDRGTLQVSAVHTLYFEQYGSPTGRPALVLHGGPGGGCSQEYRLFQPDRRVILFDQRGAGRSTPYAEIKENTLPDLIADIERLRQHLGIDQWQVLGGSWGSALGLAYAKEHRERVHDLVLRAFWNASQETGLDITTDRAGLPDGHGETYSWYRSIVPPDRELHQWMLEELTCGVTPRENEAARRFMTWDTLRAYPDATAALKELETQDPHELLAISRIFFHYFHHDFFTTHAPLLSDLHVLAGLKCTAVTGLVDLLCPPYQTHELKKAWPAVETIQIAGEGHSQFQPGMAHAVMEAIVRQAAACPWPGA